MIKEMRKLTDDRNVEVKQMREILERAEAEGRKLSDEESAQWDKMFAASEEKREKIERMQRQIEAERALADVEIGTRDRDTGRAKRANGAEEYAQAFASWCRDGFNDAGALELRALQADLGASGGFLVAPEEFVNTLIKFVDDSVYIRQWATKYRTAAQSLGAPSLDADPADADWTSELATGSEDSTMAFGKRELAPKPLAKLIKVSNKLIRNAAMSADALVLARLAYKFGISEEKAFLTGNGAGAPLGLFTASNDGVTTARDVSTDNTTTAITMNGLINAKYSLKSAYWANARWMFHRDAVKMIAKLRDESGGAGTGQYLWEPSKKIGDPDMLLGHPVAVSEHVPNTFTTGLYVGIFGDFSHYWIVDSLDMQIQRLAELYAATNQTGFIGRMEVDGMPVLAEAFARVKLA